MKIMKIKKSLGLLSVLGLAATSLTLASCELPGNSSTASPVGDSKTVLASNDISTYSSITDAQIDDFLNRYKKDYNAYQGDAPTAPTYMDAYDFLMKDVGGQVNRQGFYIDRYYEGKDEQNEDRYTYEYSSDSVTLQKGKLYYLNVSSPDVDCVGDEDYTYSNEFLFKEYFGKYISDMPLVFYAEFCPYLYWDDGEFAGLLSDKALPNCTIADMDIYTELSLRFQSKAMSYPGITCTDNCLLSFFVLATDITLNPTDAFKNFRPDYSLAMSFYEYEYAKALDFVAPDFDKNDYVFTSSVDNPLSIATILSQIHASDSVDGDVSGNVKLVSTTYDPNSLVLGTHNLTVSVMDNSGNTKTGTFKVTVYDIQAPTYVTNPYNVSYTKKLTQDVVLNMVTFSDNFSSVTKSINSDDYTMYSNSYATLGNHSIRVTGTDSAGNTTTATVVVPVIDDVAPTGSVTAKTQGCSTKLTDADIQALFSYSDAKGSCTYTLTNDSNYRANYATPGTYNIQAIIVDEAGNSTILSTTITVVDDVAPSAANGSITVAYDILLTMDEILALISPTDNYSEVSKTVNESSYAIYSARYNKLGGYAVTVELSDVAGNESSCVVNVTVEDKIAPIITAPGTIETGISNSLSLELVKSKIVVNDGYDGNITNYIISGLDDYFASYNCVASYPIVITATDASGNTTSFNVTIKTKDDVSPDFWIFSDYVITVEKGTQVTKEMILSFLGQVGEIDVAQVLEVNYELDNNMPGLYSVSLMMMDGTEYSTSINVNSEIHEDVENTVTNWFDNVKDFFAEKPYQAAASVAASIIGLAVLCMVIRFIFKKR